MKKLIFILLAFLSTQAYSQSEFSILGYSGLNKSMQRTSMGGIALDVFINENFQFNYSFKMGYSEADGFNMQTSMGALGGGWIFIESLNDGADYGTLGILACFIPEGITYNYFFDRNTILAPYINFLSMEYNQNYVGTYYEGGIKFKKYLQNDLFASLNIGMKTLYTTFQPTTYLGVNIGFFVD